MILDQAAEFIREEGGALADRDFDGFLRRLTLIYAQGCDRRKDKIFTVTAPGYAAVVEALSQRCPSCDYEDAVGQLLEFMTRLFERRNPGWKRIYRLLLAIPDSVSAKRRFESICDEDVRKWFDAGVQNLFSLQEDLQDRVHALASEIAALRTRVREMANELVSIAERGGSRRDSKVVMLEERIKARQIAALKRKIAQLVDERDSRTETARLIESDIREFQDRLRAARRVYSMHLV
jgi:hypothetical protein